MSDFSELNYINVGPKGTFKPSGNLQTSPDDIDAIFIHLQTQNISKLAVHFHGGLVKEQNGLGTAQSMYPVYQDGDAHALTFIWETGLIETISRNITQINDTKLIQKFLQYILRRLSKRLGVDVSGRGPAEPMTLEEVKSELEKVDKFEAIDDRARGGMALFGEEDIKQAEEEMVNELYLDLQGDQDFVDSEERLLDETTHLKDQREQEIRPSGKGLDTMVLAKVLASVAYRVLWRFWKGRDHGIYPTTVEEILREFYLADFGEWVWSRMKDIAAGMWDPDSGPLTDDSHPGTYFLEKLKQHQADNPDFVVDFIGHSAGAIAICEMLKSASDADTLPKIRNIVFLAPACLTRLMHDEIVRREDRFEAFRMFTMKDEVEKKDHLVPSIYTRSLLYFISGVLEDEVDAPIAGIERFWTGAKPFDDAYLVDTQNWLKAAGKNRSVLSVTMGGAAGQESESETHGGFDDDHATRKSLTHIVSQPVAMYV